MVTVVAAVLAVLPYAAAGGAVEQRLPDLAMAPLRDFRLQVTPAQRRLLRFTAEIVNLGRGPFELSAQRASADEQTMTQVQQHVIDQAGNWRSVPVDTTMYFAGDGHLHWHVRDLEQYHLESIDDAATLGVSAKGGFCFSDNRLEQAALADTPPEPHYQSCGMASDLAVNMGLSVGWGDIYAADLPDQYIDITDIPPGNYRLRATADPNHLFVEQATENNATSIVLKLDRASVQALDHSVFLNLVSADNNPHQTVMESNQTLFQTALICNLQ